MSSPPKLVCLDDLVPKDDDGNAVAIRRKPGRPRKKVVPSIHEIELAQIVNAERDQFVEADNLVRSLESRIPTPDILRAVVVELAYESAAIRQEIRSAQAAAKSDGLPQKMSRRIDALTKMASVTLEAHKLGLGTLDLKSAPVQRVFRFFVDTINDVAGATLQEPTAFKDDCIGALSGWEDQVALDGPE